MEDYCDDVEISGSWLKIGFHGDEETSEQISIIPFRDGEDVKYFVVGGVMEGGGRVTRCDMVRVMDWDQLIEYLGGRLGGAMGRDAIQAEGRRGKHAIKPEPASQYHIFLFPIFGGLPKK